MTAAIMLLQYVSMIQLYVRSNSNNSHEHADEVYALLKRKVFSWQQKDDRLTVLVSGHIVTLAKSST